jgi:hypothetical protein
MSKSRPRWAPRYGKWGPVKPGFWAIWHANKESLQDNGYAVRKNIDGQWEVMFGPSNNRKKGWPPVKKPDPIVVPPDMKASICPNCGHTRIIPRTEPHKDCGICGDRIQPEGQ